MNQSNFDGIGMTSRRTRERLVQRLRGQGISDQTVLDTIRQCPRHLFCDEALAHRAYEDSALPIGHQQTLSQPYIVARMTELLLAGGPLQRVLEIGTGSGYQTAVLAQLVGNGLCLAMRAWRSARRASTSTSCPGFSTMTEPTSSPRRSSGTPNTMHSAMLGYS